MNNALPDSAYVAMPHEFFIGDLESTQRKIIEFKNEQRKLNNPVILKLDESLLRANSDPWSVNSYMIGSMFAYTCADKVEINYRGETRVIKPKTGSVS